MMRIVHVITDLETGGAETVLAKLIGGMDRSRFENIVVSLMDEGSIGEQIRATGTPVHSLGMKRGRPALAAIVRLIRLLRQVRPALVQSWLYHADLLATLAAPFASGMPVVWNLRCSDVDMGHYTWLSRAVLRLLAWCSSLPAAVVVNSQGGQAWHERIGYHPHRWEIIPNGFDLDRFRPDPTARSRLRADLKCAPEAILVALVARVDPMKDHDTFLSAAARVAAARPQTCFLLAGEGTTSLGPAVALHGLGDRCRLLGPRADIDRILPGVDILVLSSVSEGFPNVLGEAMACGVPCVSTNVGDAGDIIGDTGLMVNPRDPSDLAMALIELIDRGEPARARLGLKARARIAENYALPAIVERYQSLYEEIGRRGAGT